MKNRILGLSILCLTLLGSLWSCKKELPIKILGQKSKSIVATSPSFEESVAIISIGTNFVDKENNNVILLKQVTSFSKSLKLLEAYRIDGIEYCDNGLFNDETANDGIYTSVKSYSATNDEINFANRTAIVHTSKAFMFTDDLGSVVNNVGKYMPAMAGIEFGCKVRLVDCPNTNWWNT